MFVLPAMGARKVAEIEFDDISRLHRKITESGKPYRANRVVALLSKAFNLASTKWKMRPDNPCKGIVRNQEETRERYLNSDELARLDKALSAYGDQDAAAAIVLLVLTGARRSEVLKATWKQLDT